MNIETSKQWKMINKLKPNDIDWDCFKSSDYFHKITTWDPSVNGKRYLKMLLYNVGMTLSKEHFEYMNKTKNRNLGYPISVKINNCEFDFDYLHSALELEVITVSGARNILEIGAGYGRTPHSIISNMNVDTYTILDLPEMLSFARDYLYRVLSDEQFKKIRFVSVIDFDNLDNSHFDLIIQIDGFNEMTKDVVDCYLDYIESHCNYFYTRNPLGNYHEIDLVDTSLDKQLNTNMRNNAVSSGNLTNTVDIHNNDEIEKNVSLFEGAYLPSDNWKLRISSWSQPVSYMWQCLYEKN
jgi:hypothetical protein